MSATIEDLTQEVVRICEVREWDNLHTPKNIAISLSVEAAELLEIFMWKTDSESTNLNDDELARVKAEAGDIFFNLINLAQVLGVDLLQVAFDKAREIDEKYPIKKFKGSAKKYNES